LIQNYIFFNFNLTVSHISILLFFIHHLMVGTILTQYQKVRDQTDIFERFETKLTHGPKSKGPKI